MKMMFLFFFFKCCKRILPATKVLYVYKVLLLCKLCYESFLCIYTSQVDLFPDVQEPYVVELIERSEERDLNV